MVLRDRSRRALEGVDVAVDQQQVSTTLGESPRRRQPDSAGGAGDERQPVAELLEAASRHPRRGLLEGPAGLDRIDKFTNPARHSLRLGLGSPVRGCDPAPSEPRSEAIGEVVVPRRDPVVAAWHDQLGRRVDDLIAPRPKQAPGNVAAIELCAMDAVGGECGRQALPSAWDPLELLQQPTPPPPGQNASP